MTPKAVQFVTLVLVLAVAATAPAAQQPRTTAAAPQPNTARAVGATAPMKAVSSVKDLMLAITIPTSEAVFKGASEPPKDSAGWLHLQLQALALAESANLLMMDGRGFSGAEWTKLSVAQRDAALVAMKAAVARNGDALSNASDALYETCDNCHARFMKK